MGSILKGSLVPAAIGCLWVIGAASPAAQERKTDAATPTPAAVQTSRLPDGTLMLTDAGGMTLYTFLKDTAQSSNCNGGCATQWPPVAATGAPPNEAWTVITRMDGSAQWAYRGKPLYRWIKDARPGDITGEGVANGAWKIAVVDTPPNIVKVHLANITATFQDAPNHQGLLPTAFAEARIAVQHAALAARAGDNLDSMKLHAGHVMHAIDPRTEPMGPGLGFGVRRAATGVVEHIQLASKAPTVSLNLLTFAARIIASANTTVKRSDEIVGVARRIRAAATAAEAAPDVARLQLLTQQLTAGLDVNHDGRIGWQTGEGGLDQTQVQLQAMLEGESN